MSHIILLNLTFSFDPISCHRCYHSPSKCFCGRNAGESKVWSRMESACKKVFNSYILMFALCLLVRNETTCHKKPKTLQTPWELKMLKREKEKERKALLEECKKLAQQKKEEEREAQRRKKRQREENLIKSASYQIVFFFSLSFPFITFIYTSMIIDFILYLTLS